VLEAYRRLLARRRDLPPALGPRVTWLDASEDVLAARRGPLVAAMNTAAEPVEVAVHDAVELLERTAAGALLTDGIATVPAAATVWLRCGSSPT
jgi:hypothetical protein